MKNERVLNLFDAYADDLYRFAISYVGSKQEAEDIVQEVFLKLLSRKLFIGKDYEKSYLLKMTANMCRDYLKSKRAAVSVNYDETMKDTGMDQSFTDKERQLYEMLMQLPDSRRAPIYLHFYEGYTYYSIRSVFKVL